MRRKRKPGGMIARRIRDKANRDDLRCRLLCLSHAELYAGCLAYTTGRESPKAAGWAANIFREITGNWPAWSLRQVAPERLPDFMIEEWMANRKKPPRRIKAEKPAPLLEAVEHPALEADETGFVPGTLMTPDDMEVSWR